MTFLEFNEKFSTAHLTIIRRYSEEHRFYCLYLGV